MHLSGGLLSVTNHKNVWSFISRKAKHAEKYMSLTCAHRSLEEKKRPATLYDPEVYDLMPFYLLLISQDALMFGQFAEPNVHITLA